MPLKMMRVAAPRGRQMAQELRCTAHQKRFKAFVRRVDDKGETYYTVKKAHERTATPAKPAEFFDMPDLLLDLDAEGSKNIRTLDEKDEEALRRKWDVDPKRDAVKAQLKYLEEQVYESREKAQGILAQPANPWRVSGHDIISAALLGAPRKPQASQPVEGGPITSQKPNIGSEALEMLRFENGIPEYAATEDESFLRWMMLRRKGQEKSIQSRPGKSGPKSEAPLPVNIIKDLQRQTSITAIRRLVLRYIDIGGDITVFANGGASGDSSNAVNFPLELRLAVLRVLESNVQSQTLAREVLAFLGTLEERLQRFNFNLKANTFQCGSSLYRLGWRLSAEVADVAATSIWLGRDYNSGWSSWRGGVEASQDALSFLKALQYMMQKQQGDVSREGLELLREREQIFTLLTGLRNHVTNDNSIRTMMTGFLDTGSPVPAQEAADVYEAYIALLGQLGAVSTLQAEWQDSAKMIEKRLQKAPGSSPKGESGDIAAIFLPALRSVLQVANIPEVTVKKTNSSSVNIDDCVSSDHAQMEGQALSAWVREGEEGSIASSSGDGFGLEEVRKVLNLPANKYLDEVRRRQQRLRV